jgi:hypothetical protein
LQTPHLQDRTPRPAIVLPCRLPAAPYRASGLVHWHLCDIARSRIDVRFRGKNGHAADITGMTEFDLPYQTFGFEPLDSGWVQPRA